MAGNKQQNRFQVLGVEILASPVLLERLMGHPGEPSQIGIAEQTLYRWRKEYGGLKVDQVRRMKDLERENAQLKKLVADLALDKAILQEASKLTF